MNNPNSFNDAWDYALWVIKAWDEASWNFKSQCDNANDKAPIRELFEQDETGNWILITWESTNIDYTKETIDWVWTKVEIYTNVFNSLFNDDDTLAVPDTEAYNTAIELWERMLHDLIAMNLDDFRNWEMWVSITNIIDITHLKGPRAKLFADTLWQAMHNVILELDILMTAWETAVLWQAPNTSAIDKIRKEWNEKVEDILSINAREEIKNMPLEAREYAEHMRNFIENLILEAHKNEDNRVDIVLKWISFNIGGTWLWVASAYEDKLDVPFEWNEIFALFEKPTKDWIIWPRSNWITLIRKTMQKIAWDWWEMLSFEEFLDIAWKEKTKLLSDELLKECSWLKMWDIATGKTTVFNPFVARKLMWWIMDSNYYNFTSQIHVTWNPARKIREWINRDERDNFWVELDLTEVKIPQIIEILQTVWEISDSDAMWSWNMWVPYALAMPADTGETSMSNEEILIDACEAEKFKIKKIWKITDWKEKSIAKWVWIWKSTIELF